MADQPLEVTLGVDTHADVHVAAVLDHLGRLQATLTIPAAPAGHQQLLEWARAHGRLTRAGVEGTGTYGAGLTRHLTQAGVTVVEVDRPNRQRRRRRGKSDPTDAEAARPRGAGRRGHRHPQSERVVTIEETQELALDRHLPDCIALEARFANVEGVGRCGCATWSATRCGCARPGSSLGGPWPGGSTCSAP